MKITAGSTILAGDPDQGCYNGHRGLRMDGKIITQEDAVIGADVPARFARGNQTVTLSFEAKKQYATAALADAAVISLSTGFDALQTVVVKTNDDVTTLLTLEDCTVDVTAAAAGTVVAYGVQIRGNKA